MIKRLASFLRDERGATAIEYSLIAVCIAVVIVGAVSSVGDQVTVMFNKAAAGFGGG